MTTTRKDNLSDADPERLADLLDAGVGNADRTEPFADGERTDVSFDEDAYSALPGIRIAGYEVLRELHRGGQGIVYEALQKSTKRKVAIKVLPQGPHAAIVARKRFEREIELVAHLNHPNIIAIFHSGVTNEGLNFYVMDYVPGLPLKQHVRSKNLTLEETLELFRTVCAAVQYAHQKGVIHRDLKPSNILVDVDDNPKVLDFGLAKSLAGQPETVVSVSHELKGTLPYMSPEQASGRTNEVDTRTDVYALGVILYELLTGHYPYPVVGQVTEVCGHIAETPPTPPAQKWSRELGVTTRSRRGLRPGECPINHEVEIIVLKALAKERERRYQSPGELARDLGHYLADEPIEAKRDSFGYVLRRQLRKHRWAVALATAFAVVVTAGVSTSLSFWIRAEYDRERVEQMTYFNQIGQAQAAYDNSLIDQMVGLLGQCRPDLRGWEWYRLTWMSDRAALTIETHETGFRHGGVAAVHSAVFSPDPDGRWIVSAGADQTIRIWDRVNSREQLALGGHDDAVTSIALDCRATRIVSGCRDGTLKVWSRVTGENTRTLRGHTKRVRSVAFSGDGTRIGSASHDHSVKIWDAGTGEELMTLLGHKGSVSCVVFNPNGQQIVSGGDDGTIRIWNPSTGKELLTLRAAEDMVTSAAFSRDGMWLVSGSFDKSLRVLHTATGEKLRSIPAETRVMCVAFSPDGKSIVSGGMDGTVRVWDVSTGAKRATLHGHRYPVNSVSFSPDGQWVLSASDTIKLWDINVPQNEITLQGFEGGILSVAHSRVQSAILSAAEDNTILLWDGRTGKVKQVFRGHNDEVLSAMLSEDGRHVVSASRDCTARIWNSETGEPISRMEHEQPVLCAAFDGDGRRVATAGQGKTIRVWDAMTGQAILTVGRHAETVNAVAFSRDGRHIASGANDALVKVWDAHTGQCVHSLSGHEYGVQRLVYSWDGRWLASGACDDKVIIWNAAAGELIHKLDGHDHDIRGIAFSHDDRRIVSRCAVGTVKIWDTSTGLEALTLARDLGGWGQVVFSPDDRRIVSGRHRGTLGIWEAVGREDGEGDSAMSLNN